MPSPSANLRVSDEERPSDVLHCAADWPAKERCMNNRMIGVAVGLVLVAIAVVSSPIAFSQMEPTPTVYTYVSQFQVPRANWASYSEDTEKTVVPIVEKMTADGTILSWSTFEQVIHTPDGYTHGAAWSSTSISGLMKVLD